MYFRQINCKRSQAEIAGYMDRTWVPYTISSSWPREIMMVCSRGSTARTPELRVN